MTTFVFVIIIIGHYISDFLLQNKYMAENKSSSLEALLVHTSVYGIFWMILTMLIFNDLILSTIFGLITFVTHTFIDFVTSKINSRLYKNNKIRLFFNVIGFDQVLHYLVLWFSFKSIL